MANKKQDCAIRNNVKNVMFNLYTIVQKKHYFTNNESKDKTYTMKNIAKHLNITYPQLHNLFHMKTEIKFTAFLKLIDYIDSYYILNSLIPNKENANNTIDLEIQTLAQTLQMIKNNNEYKFKAIQSFILEK